MKAALIAILFSSVISVSASAAILTADSTNLTRVFAAAKDGDTIKVSGTFKSIALQNRTFATRVTLDATDAVFADTVTIKNVHGLNILRGTFGSRTAMMRSLRTVAVQTSSNIKFQSNKFIGTGAIGTKDADIGLTIRDSKLVQVSGANFSNLRLGIGVNSSSNIKLGSNKFVEMTSDGINIANSHRVTATANNCSGTTIFLGAHPDCIQLWSVLGQPVQSDIALIRNVATGATQGFTSFNPEDGGGIRISMIGNIVSTSFPQGIACYKCVDSIFTDNVITTPFEAKWRTMMHIKYGTNNILSNNSIGLKAGSLLGAGDGSASLARGIANSVTGVPELSEWLMLTIGFGLVGYFNRRPQMTLQRRFA